MNTPVAPTASPLADFVKRAQDKRQPITRDSGGFLSFNAKEGRWKFGADGGEVEDEEILVNSASLQHGWIRWSKPMLKLFASIGNDLPDEPEAVEGLDFNGAPTMISPAAARQFTGRFMHDAQENFVFNTSAGSCVEETEKLYDAILEKAGSSSFCFPVVKLEKDYWQSDTRKVYFTIYNIVGWCDQEGNPEVDDVPKVAAPKSRKRTVR